MFDSLEDQIKADEHRSVSNKERAVFWTVAVLITIALFGGIYAGVQYLQG
jgi:hypothetical protein